MDRVNRYLAGALVLAAAFAASYLLFSTLAAWLAGSLV